MSFLYATMNIADLPTDIKHYIVKRVTDGVDKSPAVFSKALPILWITREWRLVALDRIYGCAYLDVFSTGSSRGDQPQRHIVNTNYSLICRNKLSHLVKRLAINDRFDSYDVDIGYLIYCVIETGISGSAPTMRINRYTSESLARYVATLLDGKHDEVGQSLGAVLARTFPNAKFIDVHTNNYKADDPTRINDIVAGFGEQLSSVAYAGYYVCLNLSPASKLTDIDLDVSIDWSEHNSLLITRTNPQYLQNIKFEVCNHTHLCKLFSWNPDSNMICFDNLRQLELVGNEDHYVDPIYNNRNFVSNAIACTHELTFPVLANLYLVNFSVYPAEFEYLLQAPLRRLTFKGLATHFLEFYNRLPSTLEYLRIDFYLDETDRELADDLNKIFPCMQGIRAVELDIDDNMCDVDVANINWPNLTHINIASQNPFFDMLDTSDNAPDLRVVKFSMFKHHMDEIDKTIEILLDIEELCPNPSSSKIHTLIIYFFIDPVDDYFYEALWNLKWYWPNLQDIVFQKHRSLLK